MGILSKLVDVHDGAIFGNVHPETTMVKQYFLTDKFIFADSPIKNAHGSKHNSVCRTLFAETRSHPSRGGPPTLKRKKQEEDFQKEIKKYTDNLKEGENEEPKRMMTGREHAMSMEGFSRKQALKDRGGWGWPQGADKVLNYGRSIANFIGEKLDKEQVDADARTKANHDQIQPDAQGNKPPLEQGKLNEKMRKLYVKALEIIAPRSAMPDPRYLPLTASRAGPKRIDGFTVTDNAKCSGKPLNNYSKDILPMNFSCLAKKEEKLGCLFPAEFYKGGGDPFDACLSRCTNNQQCGCFTYTHYPERKARCMGYQASPELRIYDAKDPETIQGQPKNAPKNPAPVPEDPTKEDQMEMKARDEDLPDDGLTTAAYQRVFEKAAANEQRTSA